ncbi:hypothetical protein LTR84_006559 [Exophiala bonariae]|uniref:Transcription factor domain-containing protein n=1 Tax=Exophiala bonariae TaxID=1690606 RepID=A0AAV9N3S8_9EURO|nr:hypothetical protein LTR84_006559 [Exophiala bonariae]
MFLFINQYSEDESGNVDRPDRHTVGSHVQRNIHQKKRSNRQTKEHSRVKRILTFRNRDILPNELQRRQEYAVDNTLSSEADSRSVYAGQLAGLNKVSPGLEHKTSQEKVTNAGYSIIQPEALRGKVSPAVDPGLKLSIKGRMAPSQRGRGCSPSIHSANSRESSAVHSPETLPTSELWNDELAIEQGGAFGPPEYQDFGERTYGLMESSSLESTELMQVTEQSIPVDGFPKAASLSPYQPVGHGTGDPFASTVLPVTPFYGRLITYFQTSFTYRSVERLCQNAGARWIQTLISDQPAMHGLYANALFLAARLCQDSDKKRAMMLLAMGHDNFSIAVTRRRLREKKDLRLVAFGMISLLISAYSTEDWPSYRLHLQGMASVVQLLGGFSSIDDLLLLILLAGETQASSHMLVRPALSSQAWPRRDWDNYYPPTDTSSHNLPNQSSHEASVATTLPSEVLELFRDVRGLYHATVLLNQNAHNSNTYIAVRRSLQFRYHFLNISLLDSYRDLQEKHEDEHRLGTNRSSLAQVFLVALMCCHQFLYHTIVDPSVLQMRYIPFYHIQKHLEDLEPLCLDAIFPTPGDIDVLIWISFIGAYSEISRRDSVKVTRSKGPNTMAFLRFARIQHRMDPSHRDIKVTLESFIYHELLFTPVLEYLRCLVISESP